VLRKVCQKLASWRLHPLLSQLTLAVNVSVRQFHEADFVDSVLEILAVTGANPARLKLEMTESLLAENIDEITVKMGLLRKQGITFSLDDFGTGYSSLSYLQRLPLDELKIDRSFVRDVLNSPNDAAIARIVIALADNLGLAVIAEGVETQAQREFLASSGCYKYQGFLFGEPVPMAQFEAALGAA
jgi:EAL domain-containing protein (putative c-di-GMP-specific phosphodiesterase class I)